MKGNIYYLLSFFPATEKEDMISGYEKLARQVVKSGRLRIDAGEKINFARFYEPYLDISMMFSYRELYDPELITRTRSLMAAQLSKSIGPSKIDAELDKHIGILKNELKKYQKVTVEEELQLARLIVQAAHPVVTMLILEENVEIFLSHSYNIGDMLDVVNWKTSGQNNGMQSTDGRDVAVFISCDGDPLGKNENPKATYGDGWPAMARLLVVAGQEMGHYSDIQRDNHGKQISRYSANFNGTRAKDNVRQGRLDDIKICKEILKNLSDKCFFDKLITQEKTLKFFRENKRYDTKFCFEWIKWKIAKHKFLSKAKKNDLFFVNKYASHLYTGLIVKTVLEDMLFNLTPVADAYSREDKKEEEAIACIEALARVPQQRNKWGKLMTKTCMANLYKIYYGQVIPGCIEAYKNMTKKEYKFDDSMEDNSIFQKVKRLFTKKKPPLFVE
jgi:hypothetical protein